MTPRSLVPLFLAALASPAVLADHAGSHCIVLPDEALACGELVVSCGAAAASGRATRVVEWRFHVGDPSTVTTQAATGVAATFSADTGCEPVGCAIAALYADGEEVVRGQSCW